MDFSKAANFGSWFSDDSDLTGTQAGGDDPSTTDVSDSNNSIPEKQDDADIEEHVHSELCDQFGCKPYKIELLDRQLANNSPGSGRRTAVIETLRGMGVKVFVIDAKNTQSTADVVQHIRRVVGFVARENCVQQNGGPLGFQRCLFYQDDQGRLFNLMLSKHVTGPSGTWSQYLETFSGREAMIALTVLCRSLPCIWNEETVQNLRPAYLSLILGLVLTEEISLSWLNASMLIRATPSVSAHALTSPVGSDALRKIIILCLALAGATKGTLQSILTCIGIIGALVVLLANLGARSWHFLRWKPMRYTGPGSFFMAYLLAILAGICLPYMGHRSISTGGKGAMEYVVSTAFIVAVAFVLSDIDDIQSFLVVGSEGCDQDIVNLGVGCWWTVTLLISLFLTKSIPYLDQAPSHGERVLVEDISSPVGYRVPSLPDFEIDPSLANTGIKVFPLACEFAFGTIVALAVGGWLIALAFTSWEDDLLDKISDGFQ